MDTADIQLLTPREVDQLLRLPRGRAVRMADAGQLPAVRLPSGDLRFRADDLARVLQATTATEAGASDE